MAKTATADTVTISKRELKAMLREVVREAIHDELHKFVTGAGEDWELEEGSVLWQDLVELQQEIQEGRLELLTHEQVFGK